MPLPDDSTVTPAYVALDPGDTTGWATFDATGKVIAYGQFGEHEQTEWLRKLILSTVQCVIVEDYVNYKKLRQPTGSRNKTSKLIGKIEFACDAEHVPYVLQPAHNKVIGYKWAGLGEAPSNHSISHQYDAIAHGVYYLQQKGIRPVGMGMK